VSLLEGGLWNTKLVVRDWPFSPKLQFDEYTKPHLGIVEWNSPMSVCRRFSLTQEGQVGSFPVVKGQQKE